MEEDPSTVYRRYRLLYQREFEGAENDCVSIYIHPNIMRAPQATSLPRASLTRLRKKELREELANLKSLDRQHKQVLQEKEEKWALQQKALVDIIQELDEKMAVDVALVKKLVTDVDVSIKKAVKELEGLV
ncbi:hypothetical protein ASPNIDRAFT_40114 [Aspergillus niger ATCC 1015]|uniref:Uncharacterized protein n=1 Tax=Aspergillus niger (strain ATCC 1015 / CBS 113.46 / FGSC A1144 / LSHB Ac4 / NCTC 3858a / NRRL 328 / USDA 3528.7) TaxID=380704 RepID=G3Y0B4_ASPNA|nr:hypothetical protein ASPNIDRAFT_40114 [Aspergillus niger ATCC 1015]